MRNLFLFIAAMSLQANAADPRLDYQKGLSQMGDQQGKSLKNIRTEGKELLAVARLESNGISQQDYNFLKGTSAFAASGAEWAHNENVFGDGVTILLLEDAGVNHADIRSIVEPGSPRDPISGMKYKLDHGSAMASHIHAITPRSNIRVRPIQELNESRNLNNVRIINASFGSENEGGFLNTFGRITEANNILITKSAGNHQENLSEHPDTKDCEPLIPFTIFTGNLRQDYKGKTSSGVPGDNPDFQNSFLWVIADDVLTASGSKDSTQYSPETGTSNAAAILSGAAALILSKHPSFSTAALKEILLESADRDFFQTFGSGYKALHMPDMSVDFNRKHTQYIKKHKDKSMLDFAEERAYSKDYALAAEIISGNKGEVRTTAPTSEEIEQFKRILKKLKESGNTDLPSLSPSTTENTALKQHRQQLQRLLSEDITIPNTTDKEKTLNYDPTFWGKGILNIRNALIYAELKIQNPEMSVQELRERMLKKINDLEQTAAVDIQRIIRGKLINRTSKQTEEELAKRQRLTINTSLPDRQFTRMPHDPAEAVVIDQTDRERLHGLGMAVPDAPAGRGLKVISDDTTVSSSAATAHAREFESILNSDVPANASTELRAFLTAGQKNLIEKFTVFSENEILPLLNLSPEDAADRLIEMHQSLGQFNANRVISINTKKTSFQSAKNTVSIIGLLHDFMRNKEVINNDSTNEDKKKKTAEIAIQLLKRFKATGTMTDFIKSELLSLLKDYGHRSEEVNNSIIENDLLGTHFVHYEIDTSEGQFKSKNYIGLDIVASWNLKSIIDNHPSPETKAALKRFFKTKTGVKHLAQIAIKGPIQESIYKQKINYSSFRWNTPEITTDITEEGRRILPIIFENATLYLPQLFSILRDYADKDDISALISAMNLEDNQIQIEGTTPGLTALVNEYLAATLPNVFE